MLQERPVQAMGYRTPAVVYQQGRLQNRRLAVKKQFIPSGIVKPSPGAGDSLDLALGVS